MNVATLGARIEFFTACRAFDVSEAGRQRRETDAILAEVAALTAADASSCRLTPFSTLSSDVMAPLLLC